MWPEKNARIFFREQFSERVAGGKLRASRKADKVQGQISEHIFYSQIEVFCVGLLRNARGLLKIREYHSNFPQQF